MYDKLRYKKGHKQVNPEDVIVLDASETSATFFVRFPGLYLTYDHEGKLVSTQTIKERELAGETLVGSKRQGILAQDGEMGT